MKNSDFKKTLLIGIGNSAREDDGLGWMFLEHLEKSTIFKGESICKFQLNIEDAELISYYDSVIFIDAFKGELPDGFYVTPCLPSSGNGFSTHLLQPETVLYLAGAFYNRMPNTWILGIQGYQWELKEGISKQAEKNLLKALDWFKLYSTNNLPFEDVF